MKRLVLAGIATLALGAFAQGVINLDNSTTPYGVTVDASYVNGGTYYSGTFGMEVWELSGATSLPAGINLPATMGSGVLAYDDMVAAGSKKEGTYAGQTMIGGAFSLGNLTMADVTPPGSQVLLGLAIWNTSAASWASMLSSSTAATRAGVLAFLNPTSFPGIGFPPPIGANINAGWTAAGVDLVMTAIPEPCTFALAGLGVALLFIFRRWR
jgi:hypothetical protein